MPTYNDIQGRADVADAMMPDQVVAEIIKAAPASSAILSRARRATMSKKKAKQAVLATLPDAYWVDGDTGPAQTSKSVWDNVYITAEELAVIVPIPDAVIEDSDVPLWAEILPLLVEAAGKKVDAAAIFGQSKPDSWPTALVDGAVAAQNAVALGTGKDIGVDVAALAEAMSAKGASPDGFCCRPGLQWSLRGLRDDNGQPIYASLPDSPASGLYGMPLDEVKNGAWDAEKAVLLAADWNKVVCGIRRDITYNLYSEGVISDASGKVVLNLMQQGCKAMKVTMRVGFQVAAPATRLGKAYPAGIITPAAAKPATPPSGDESEG